MHEICFYTLLGGSAQMTGKEITLEVMEKKPVLVAAIEPRGNWYPLKRVNFNLFLFIKVDTRHLNCKILMNPILSKTIKSCNKVFTELRFQLISQGIECCRWRYMKKYGSD